MSDRKNDRRKKKEKAPEPVNEARNDDEDGDLDEEDSENRENAGKAAVAAPATQPLAPPDITDQGRGEKTLRFILPQRSETNGELLAQVEMKRSANDQEGESAGSIAGFPLVVPQTRPVSELVKALESDMTEDEALYLDSKHQFFQPANFAFKPLYDALKRSPTNSTADYHLLLSAHLRCLEGVVQALEEGANVNATQDHLTPLLIATNHNDKSMVDFLVTVQGIDLEVKNIFGCVPLLIALKNGFDEIAILLLKCNAELNVVDSMGRTPLHIAVLQENYDMVKVLIRFGHQLEIPDRFGEKPIYTCSVKKPNLKLLNLLLHAGASCEYESVTGLNLLSTAILKSTNIQVIKKLVVAGANVNHQDYFCKRTPLHMAATIDNVKIAKFLVDHGADADLRTIAGYTAFDLAMYYRCLDVAEYLAIYTKNPALCSENFNSSFCKRVPKSGPLSLVVNTRRPSKVRRNSHIYYQ